MAALNLAKIRSVLFFMPGGIGNMVLALPALRLLRQTLSGRRIVLLVMEKCAAEILGRENLVDEVVNFADGFSTWWKLRRTRFDLGISSSHTNPWRSGLLFVSLGIPWRIGEMWRGRKLFYTHAVAIDKTTHETDGMLALLAAAGIDSRQAERWPRLSVADCDRQAVLRILPAMAQSNTLFIGIHAGSGRHQTFKRWPAERFAALADQLAGQYGATVVLTGGMEEMALAARITQIMQTPAINAVGKFSLSETAALISLCRLFISNDSGLAHIAAALQVPLLVLFGPTNPARIGPRGPHVRIIRKTTAVLDRPFARDRPAQEKMMHLISIQDVLDGARQLLTSLAT